jgi:hypothetical protein
VGHPTHRRAFALLGVAITLFVNHRLQSARDKRDRRAKEYEQLFDWTERALAAGGSIYRWVGNQETPTPFSFVAP